MFEVHKTCYWNAYHKYLSRSCVIWVYTWKLFPWISVDVNWMWVWRVVAHTLFLGFKTFMCKYIIWLFGREFPSRLIHSDDIKWCILLISLTMRWRIRKFSGKYFLWHEFKKWNSIFYKTASYGKKKFLPAMKVETLSLRCGFCIFTFVTHAFAIPIALQKSRFGSAILVSGMYRCLLQ